MGRGYHKIEGKSVYLVMPDRFDRVGGHSAVPWRVPFFTFTSKRLKRTILPLDVGSGLKQG